MKSQVTTKADKIKTKEPISSLCYGGLSNGVWQEKVVGHSEKTEAISPLYFHLDKDYKILMCNQPAIDQLILHFDHAPQQGSSILQYIPADAQILFKKYYQQCLADNFIKTERKFVLPDLPLAHYESYFHPVYNLNREVVGVSLWVHITTTTKANGIQNKVDSQLHFSQIYNTTSNPIFLIKVEENNQFRFLSVNQAYCTMTGIKEKLITGRLIHEVYPKSIVTTLQRFQTCIQARQSIQYEEVILLAEDILYLETTLSPYFNTKGQCTHLIGVARDISERKKAEQQIQHLCKEMQDKNKELTTQVERLQQRLQESLQLNEKLVASEILLKEAQSIAQLSRFEYDVASQNLEWLDKALKIYGFENEGEITDFSQYLNLIHPQDRDALGQAIDEAINLGKGYKLEIRILINEKTCWNLAIGKPILDEMGKTIKLIGLSWT